MIPKAIHATQVTVWYIVLDVPYKVVGPKLKEVDDVRLYEVSPSSAPGKRHGPRLGMLVAGASSGEAYETCLDILKSYKIMWF